MHVVSQASVKYRETDNYICKHSTKSRVTSEFFWRIEIVHSESPDVWRYIRIKRRNISCNKQDSPPTSVWRPTPSRNTGWWRRIPTGHRQGSIRRVRCRRRHGPWRKLASLVCRPCCSPRWSSCNAAGWTPVDCHSCLQSSPCTTLHRTTHLLLILFLTWRAHQVVLRRPGQMPRDKEFHQVLIVGRNSQCTYLGVQSVPPFGVRIGTTG